MDAPLWKLDRLKASGQQQVNRASELLAFAGFRWPNPTHFVSAEEHPEVFLILDPVYIGKGEVFVARTDSSAAAKRVFEIFDEARLLLLEQRQTLDLAVRGGFSNIQVYFFMRLKALLQNRDTYYSDFGPLVLKSTLTHIGEAVMDEYRTTDKATVNTKAVHKAWSAARSFVSLAAPNHSSLYDPEGRRSGAPMRAPSSLTTNAPAATPASSDATTRPDSNRPIGTRLILPKPPSAGNTDPLRTTINGRENQAASKRKLADAPASSTKPGKRARQDSAPHMSDTAGHSEGSEDSLSNMAELRHGALEKAAENQDLRKQMLAMVESSRASEANEANEAKLQKENRDLKDRLEAMEGSAEKNEANRAELQRELVLKVMEAAGLEADNQRLKETGSFKQRLELARQAVEVEKKTARIRDLEETEGALRKRVGELEALQKEAARAKDLEGARGVLRKCKEQLEAFQSNAGVAKNTDEDIRLLREYVEELKALQVTTAGIEDAEQVEGLLREGIKDLEVLFKVRDLGF